MISPPARVPQLPAKTAGNFCTRSLSSAGEGAAVRRHLGPRGLAGAPGSWALIPDECRLAVGVLRRHRAPLPLHPHGLFNSSGLKPVSALP